MSVREADVENETGNDTDHRPAPQSVAVAVAVADQKLRRLLLDGLDIAGLPVVDQNVDVSSSDSLLASIGRLKPDILFLGINGLSGDCDAIIARIAALKPGPRVVAVNETAAPEAIKMTMRAGAAEFVYPPFVSREFEEALSRVASDCARVAEEGRVSGAILGFVSAKGGCGATTLACHSAGYLRSATKKEVLLADLDTASGIAGVIMQAGGRYNLQDAFQNLHRMDLKLWKGLVTASPSGVDVIPASPDLPSGATAIPRRVSAIFRFWQTQYDYTIADFGHGLSQPLLDSLDTMDSLVLVTTNEVLALRRAKSIIQTLASRNFGANRLRLVINRMPKRTQITVAELEKVMGQPVYATIPNDYAPLSEAYSEPRLLDSGSDLNLHIGKMAAKLTGTDKDRKERRSFFGLGRKK